MKKKILVIQGPNINLIGERETSVYGSESIDVINKEIIDYAEKFNIKADIFQSNIEGELVTEIQKARKEYDGIIINAGAYTHYSIAIRDAIAAIKIPCIEVHFSNINAREEFRKISVIAPVCAGSIIGFGKFSYLLAVKGIAEFI
ncbi:MAG: type II 3-dehydroquinate dehydratase [Clostridia bacterium]|nr:type II 3-dehydroquinate dehydratase [Clostridia bacterium]